LFERQRLTFVDPLIGSIGDGHRDRSGVVTDPVTISRRLVNALPAAVKRVRRVPPQGGQR
jgi:hypothetical protein